MTILLYFAVQMLIIVVAIPIILRLWRKQIKEDQDQLDDTLKAIDAHYTMIDKRTREFERVHAEARRIIDLNELPNQARQVTRFNTGCSEKDEFRTHAMERFLFENSRDSLDTDELKHRWDNAYRALMRDKPSAVDKAYWFHVNKIQYFREKAKGEDLSCSVIMQKPVVMRDLFFLVYVGAMYPEYQKIHEKMWAELMRSKPEYESEADWYDLTRIQYLRTTFGLKEGDHR